MNTSLSHLPQENQRELSDIVERIKSVAMPEKIILFGSYASGKNVDEYYIKNNTIYDYVSDYDILVLYSKTDLEYYEIEDKVLQTYEYKAPLNLIIQHIGAVNNKLSSGDYFFKEIISRGICLYNSGNIDLVPPKILSKEELKSKAIGDFKFFFDNGSKFLQHAIIDFDDSKAKGEKPNLAAYFLHQAAESFYSMLLLVYTGFKPKTHNLDKFRKLNKQMAVEITEVFPLNAHNKREAYLFDLLKRAYIGGKYKRDFEVSYDDVKDLISQVSKLKKVTEQHCNVKISMLS